MWRALVCIIPSTYIIFNKILECLQCNAFGMYELDIYAQKVKNHKNMSKIK